MTIGISKERLEELSSKASRLEDKDFLETLIFQCTELNPWLPIDENTPKDRPILIYDGKFKRIAFWFKDNQTFLDEWGNAISANHYQELPGDPD